MMIGKMIRCGAVFAFCSVWLAVCASAQSTPPFSASALVKLGDNVRYGSYKIIKIGDGIYQINDPGDPKTKGGGMGVDMYLVCGTRKALMIDLGNNYIDGYAKDDIKPRPNAAEELRAVVAGLAGKLPVEAAITHAHPDHDGMTGAFTNPKNVTIWMPEGEDLNAPKTQHQIDPSVYTVFPPGKTFDLGGGRIVTPFYVRGHSNGSTVYFLPKDMLLFTGDAMGSGFGQGFGRTEVLKRFAEDSQKLVDFMKATYSPYERYALRVYTGHTWQNTYAGFMNPNHAQVDVGYLDWRFVQDMTSCAAKILKGEWLVEGSGLQFIGKKGSTERWANYMVYGIGSVAISLEAAYEAAGLKMPQ